MVYTTCVLHIHSHLCLVQAFSHHLDYLSLLKIWISTVRFLTVAHILTLAKISGSPRIDVLHKAECSILRLQHLVNALGTCQLHRNHIALLITLVIVEERIGKLYSYASQLLSLGNDKLVRVLNLIVIGWHHLDGSAIDFITITKTGIRYIVHGNVIVVAIATGTIGLDVDDVVVIVGKVSFLILTQLHGAHITSIGKIDSSFSVISKFLVTALAGSGHQQSHGSNAYCIQ